MRENLLLQFNGTRLMYSFLQMDEKGTRKHAVCIQADILIFINGWKRYAEICSLYRTLSGRMGYSGWSYTRKFISLYFIFFFSLKIFFKKTYTYPLLVGCDDVRIYKEEHVNEDLPRPNQPWPSIYISIRYTTYLSCTYVHAQKFLTYFLGACMHL